MAAAKGWSRIRITQTGDYPMLNLNTKRWHNRLLATVFGLTAATGAASADPVNNPPMAGPITGNPNPFSVEVPEFFGPAAGKMYIGGALSGMAFYQDNPGGAFPGDKHSLMDLVDAQVFLNKNEGWFQFFVQAGHYTVHSLGVPYIKTSAYTPGTFGFVPQAYIKIAPADNFSVQVGKLPTLIGYETTFSFQNANVERGLLWGQENAVNQGVQLNYSTGPLSFSLAVADGFYSSRLNVITGLATWTIDPNNILAFAGGGKLSNTGYARVFTNLAVNNQSIYNLMYTHIDGNWTIAPYLQYTRWTAIRPSALAPALRPMARRCSPATPLTKTGRSPCVPNTSRIRARALARRTCSMARAAMRIRSPSPRPISGAFGLSARNSRTWRQAASRPVRALVRSVSAPTRPALSFRLVSTSNSKLIQNA